MQLMAWYYEKDFLLISKRKDGSSKTRKPAVQVSSKFPRYEYDYTLEMSERDTNNRLTSFTKSVGKFFDSDGVFHEELYLTEVKQLIQTFERKKGD